MPQELCGLAVMSARQQRPSYQEPKGVSVGTLGACLDRSPLKESVGRLRSFRIDKTPGDSEPPFDGGTSDLAPVGVRIDGRFGAHCFGPRITAQVDASREDGGCEAAVSAQCLQGVGMQVWRLAPKTPVKESRSNSPTASSAFGPVNVPYIV